MTFRIVRQRFLCLVAVSLLPVCLGTSCPPSLTEDLVSAAGQAVAENVRAGLENGLGQKALDEAVALALEQPGVRGAYLSSDGTTIVMRFDDGRVHYVLTQRIDSPVKEVAAKSKSPSPIAWPAQSISRDGNKFRTIGPKTAAIYSPFQDQLSYDLSEIAKQLHAAGFTINGNGDVFRWTNARADLDALKGILEDNYGVIIILTHGGIGDYSKVILATRQTHDSSLDTEPWGGPANIQSADAGVGKNVCAVNPGFVARYAHADSLVLLMACHALENDTMARAFLDHGACGCIGYSDETSMAIAEKAVEYVIEFLCEGDYAYEAVARTRHTIRLWGKTFLLNWLNTTIDVNYLTAYPIDSNCTIVSSSPPDNQPPINPNPSPLPNQLPVAKPQSVGVAHNTPATITLQASDPDNGPDPLSYSLTVNPSYGTCSISGAIATYKPNPDYPGGPDSFKFRAFDGKGYSNTVTVNITVQSLPPNQLPVAKSQSAGATFNTPATITLEATDPDNGPQPLSYSLTVNPSYGTCSISGAIATYKPNPDYPGGPDSFKFRAYDGRGYSNTATVNIIVQSLPTLSLAVAQSPLISVVRPCTPITFTCIVTNNGIPIPNATIPINISDPSTTSAQPIVTGPNGQGSYVASLVHTGSICFGPATLAGYNPSASACRSVTVVENAVQNGVLAQTTTAISAGAFACVISGQGSPTIDNRYARAFNNLPDAFDVECVQFGVEANQVAPYLVEVKLWRNSVCGPPNDTSMIQVGQTVTTIVPLTEVTDPRLISVSMPAPVHFAAGENMVVEIHAPDRSSGDQGSFFIGSNTVGAPPPDGVSSYWQGGCTFSWQTSLDVGLYYGLPTNRDYVIQVRSGNCP